MKHRARRRALVTGAVAAYAQWQGESAAVRRAYRRWVGASPAEKRHAFADYNVALNREERAASRFAQLVGRAGHLPETGLVRQLAQIDLPRLP